MNEKAKEQQLVDKSTSGDEWNIDRCGRCQSRLALRRPTAEWPASPWRCRRCDAVFLASPQLREGRCFTAGTRAAFYFDVIGDAVQRPAAAPVGVSAQDVVRLRQCLTQPTGDRPESRRHRRHPVLAAVTLIPLSQDLRIVDVPSAAIAVNVSAGGLAILHNSLLTTPFLAVDFSLAHAALSPVVLEKVRTRKVGEAHEIAGKLISRIEY